MLAPLATGTMVLRPVRSNGDACDGAAHSNSLLLREEDPIVFNSIVPLDPSIRQPRNPVTGAPRGTGARPRFLLRSYTRTCLTWYPHTGRGSAQ